MAQIVVKKSNLNTWQEESYTVGAGKWTVATNGEEVIQSLNGDPTIFYSDFTVFNTKVSGKIIPGTSSDDDYIGFVLGFEPGDTKNPAANYLLIDWKQKDQKWDVNPSKKGLALSEVTGIPAVFDFWSHVNKIKELSRGKTLGDKGWEVNVEYTFDFVYTKTNLQIFVNGNLEIDINGNFTEGRIGFYNYSQDNVTYKSFESKVFPNGKLNVPSDTESGIDFLNPLDSGNAKVKVTPSGKWSIKPGTEVTAAGEPNAELITQVAYPNNTPYALVAVDKTTNQVIAEIGSEKILSLTTGQTITFKINDESGWYWDNSGSITVDWIVVE